MPDEDKTGPPPADPTETTNTPPPAQETAAAPPVQEPTPTAPTPTAPPPPAPGVIADPITAPTPSPFAAQGNTSGQGSGAIVPEEVKGWSWGAFFLTWIWGIGNSVWLALLAFVPFVNLVIPFVLGIKGREWAWQAKRWDSIEHFKKTQRTWDLVGIIIGVLIVLMVLFVFFTTFMAVLNAPSGDLR